MVVKGLRKQTAENHAERHDFVDVGYFFKRVINA
jgi:hypothetical protein